MIDFKQKIEQDERYRYPAEEEPLTNKKTKRLFIYLGVLGVVIMLFAWKVIASSQNSGNWFTNNFLGTVSHLVINQTREIKGEENDRINILLLGNGGSNHDGGNLTDTIIILSLKPSTKEASMISVPRDMLAPAGDGTWKKINSIHAYAEKNKKGSGGEKTIEMVSELLDEPIPYFIRADFEGFTNIIDEIGGVDVYVENTFDDYTYPVMGREDAADYYSRYEHLHFDQGWKKMDGSTALKYARSRHSLGLEGNDFARAKRQQIILEATKEKVLSRSTLTNPATLTKIISQLDSHISTNLSITEMIRLWNMFKDIQKNQIINKVLDNSVSGLLIDGRGDDNAYILLPRGGSFKPIRDLIDGIFGDYNQSGSQSDIFAPATKVIEKKKISKIATSASVEILNGTWTAGLASKASADLKNAGFIVEKLGNSPERNYTKNTIYDLTHGSKNEALEALKSGFNAEVSFSWPLWLEEKIFNQQDKEIIKTPTSTKEIASNNDLEGPEATEIEGETEVIADKKEITTEKDNNEKIKTSTGPDFILILGE